MGQEELERIAKQWDEMTHRVLDLQKFSFAEMRNLLRDTYVVLTAFHKDQFVPKQISRILLNMDEFLYFTSLMEGNEVAVDFYRYQALSSVIAALKAGFFAAEYAYTYPRLQICDPKGMSHIVDLEKVDLETLLC